MVWISFIFILNFCSLSVVRSTSFVKDCSNRCGAAPLSPKIQQAVYQRLNRPIIKQGYGMTETTLSVLRNAVDSKPGSIGKLCPDTFGK